MLIIFIIGLPGSGKSYLLKQFPSDFYIVDDPKTLNDFVPTHGQNKIVIAHPHLCSSLALDDLQSYLRSYYSENISFITLYFNSNPEQCVINSNSEERKDKLLIITLLLLQ